MKALHDGVAVCKQYQTDVERDSYHLACKVSGTPNIHCTISTIDINSKCRLRRQNPCSRMEIQIVTTEVYRKVHNLQSKSTESHGSKEEEGKKF